MRAQGCAVDNFFFFFLSSFFCVPPPMLCTLLVAGWQPVASVLAHAALEMVPSQWTQALYVAEF